MPKLKEMKAEEQSIRAITKNGDSGHIPMPARAVGKFALVRVMREDEVKALANEDLLPVSRKAHQ